MSSADYELTMSDGEVHVRYCGIGGRLPEPMHSRWVDEHGQRGGESSVSEFLGRERIIKVIKLDNGMFRLLEGCDEYYAVDVDRAVLAQWINELQEMLDEGSGDGAGDPATT